MPRTETSEKRQQIVDTAYALFRRGGFHATGIDLIIAEAAVAKMTMYRHFPSKDDLIVEVLAWRQKRFEALLDRLVEAASEADRKIAAIFDWYGRWFERADFRGCLFQHALGEFEKGHPVFEAAARQKANLKRRMRDILKASMPKDRADSVAGGLLALIEGATVLAEMGQGKAAARDARRAAMRLLSESKPPR